MLVNHRIGNFWSVKPEIILVQPQDQFYPKKHVCTTFSPDLSFIFKRNNINDNRDDKKKKSKIILDDFQVKNDKKEWKFDDIIDDLKKDSIINLISEEKNKENDIKNDNCEVFMDIPLTEEGDKNRINTESRPQNENRLAHLFDQFLIDISKQKYGSFKNKKINRRKSELCCKQLDNSREILYRHHSYPSIENRVERHFGKTFITGVEGYDRDKYDEIPSWSLFERFEILELEKMNLKGLKNIKIDLDDKIEFTGNCLVLELENKDKLKVKQQELCEIITATLQAISKKTRDDTRLTFSLSPVMSDQSGFQEWARAMRMVARLPDGVPGHFRKNLWLSLAERHLNTKGHTNWAQTERRIFSETTTSEDRELSVQIVKDLHRTGCSLFCGATGQHNQAVLKRVLLAYARWNKNVGYCQGLNMLAALILQVMQGSQSATVKVMIYLIEGVLPESYFGNNLRGLSVDMAVFRDLLRLKLPELSKHLDHLQQESKDSGTSYEPPLCDVFTMQWFLTLFSTCLPQSTILRVWDLVFLEGDQILLRTALAIWQSLSDRMMAVRSADEFYSIMAVLTREMMEFGLMEPNNLIKVIDSISIPEVTELREKYVYNISPWAVGTVAKMGLKLFYPDTEQTGDDMRDVKMTPFSNHPDREKIALDISALKRQYWKLRERQRQAHIILSACRSETLTGNSATLNHLLLGKKALLSAKGRKIEGTIPNLKDKKKEEPQTIRWKDKKDRSRSPSPSSSSSSSSTELCDSSDSEDFSIQEDAKGIEIKTPEVVVEGENDEKNDGNDQTNDGNDQKNDENDQKSDENDQKCDESDFKPERRERRKSEIALLQILQENSEILQRIQSQRVDEPDEIAEIRKKYSRVVSLDDPCTSSSSSIQNPVISSSSSMSSGIYPQPRPDLPRFSPFPVKSPRKKEVGISLGLYTDN